MLGDPFLLLPGLEPNNLWATRYPDTSGARDRHRLFRHAHIRILIVEINMILRLDPDELPRIPDCIICLLRKLGEECSILRPVDKQDGSWGYEGCVERWNYRGSIVQGMQQSSSQTS